MDMTINLKKPLFMDGRILPCGIAVSQAIYDHLMTMVESADHPLTLRGVPVIVLAVLAESEVRVAMTPMAWMQLLVEKRREELVGGER